MVLVENTSVMCLSCTVRHFFNITQPHSGSKKHILPFLSMYKCPTAAVSLFAAAKYDNTILVSRFVRLLYQT